MRGVYRGSSPVNSSRPVCRSNARGCGAPHVFSMTTGLIRGAVFATAAVMFQLESADYVRLTYESLRQAYEGHAEAAARLSRFSSYFRMATLGMTGAAAVLAAIALSSG